MGNDHPAEAVLTRVQATKYLCELGYPVGSQFLAVLATKNEGPPFQVVGIRSFYRASELETWARWYGRRECDASKMRAV